MNVRLAQANPHILSESVKISGGMLPGYTPTDQIPHLACLKGLNMPSVAAGNAPAAVANAAAIQAPAAAVNAANIVASAPLKLGLITPQTASLIFQNVLQIGLIAAVAVQTVKAVWNFITGRG